MTLSPHLYLYDTTLRDGAQTRGVDFSLCDKRTIAGWLDFLGLDYVEGGWPGANPADTAFFSDPPSLKQTCLCAFGMTRRAQNRPEEDEGFQKVLNVSAPAVCLVGKTWDFHVTEALRVSLEENLEIIRSSLECAVRCGKEVLFDAEHFFDGYKANPRYAVACLQAALSAGARWLVLCDTNGGTLPHEITQVICEVSAFVPLEKVGFHGHNDTGNAVANSLMAVQAGCRMVQGTLGGLGERCGNADLLALIPTFVKKMGYDVGVSEESLQGLTQLSHDFDKLLDRVPNAHAPYIGASAFAHKGGLHVSAIAKNPSLYEHMDPAQVGNGREVLMSRQAGQANVKLKLKALGLHVAENDPLLPALLETVKEREQEGYAYDNAAGSFALLALRKLGRLDAPFVVQDFTVKDRGVLHAEGRFCMMTQAQVSVKIGPHETGACAEGNGPVHALDSALRKALLGHFPQLETVSLSDYRVRILNTGAATGATTRVLLEAQDSARHARWSCVGVSTNILAASLEALIDAYMFKLVMFRAIEAEAA